MQDTRSITKDIYWVGGNDRRIALFENLFPLDSGVSYNSYIIIDEKTALMDTVDASITHQFLENISYILDGRTLDYLVINHMEPDHCANVEELVRRYPDIRIILNIKTVQFAKQFFEFNIEEHAVIVKEMDEISLGSHVLQFIMAPMVHWPEVMVTYEKSQKILFSADAFGSFGVINGSLFNDDIEVKTHYLEESRRYYSNIVGKYGMQVQSLLKKAADLDIQYICPLHGVVWRNDLAYLLEKYDKWSKYQYEDNSIVIMYGSMYGNTENAVNILAGKLTEGGIKNVAVYDVSKIHYSYLIGEIFRCSHIVLASPTYNAGLYPSMDALLRDMKALNISNRTIALIENGSWAPASARHMISILNEMKEMTIIEPVISLKSSVKKPDLDSITELSDNIIESITKNSSLL